MSDGGLEFALGKMLHKGFIVQKTPADKSQSTVFEIANAAGFWHIKAT